MVIEGPVRDGPPLRRETDGSALRWAGQPPLGNGLVSPGLVSPKFLRGRPWLILKAKAASMRPSSQLGKRGEAPAVDCGWLGGGKRHL